jgi:hypothetical protein
VRKSKCVFKVCPLLSVRIRMMIKICAPLLISVCQHLATESRAVIINQEMLSNNNESASGDDTHKQQEGGEKLPHQKERAGALEMIAKASAKEAARREKDEKRSQEDIRKTVVNTKRCCFYRVPIQQKHASREELVTAMMLTNYDYAQWMSKLDKEKQAEIKMVTTCTELIHIHFWSTLESKEDRELVPIVSYPSYQLVMPAKGPMACSLCCKTGDSVKECSKCSSWYCRNCLRRLHRGTPTCDAVKAQFDIARKLVPKLTTSHPMVCVSIACPSPTTSAKLLKCAECEMAHYCSKECQEADWKAVHRTECALLISSRAAC